MDIHGYKLGICVFFHGFMNNSLNEIYGDVYDRLDYKAHATHETMHVLETWEHNRPI